MTVRKRVLVEGQVQGVFFRDSCRRVAREAGVSGTAANLPDGKVEVVLEGEDDSVDRVIEWCRRGTDYSDVRSVEVSDEKPRGLEGFSIL